MDHAEATALFQRFAVPLAGYASSSPARKESAEMLAKSLWIAMIAGPEMEEETWKALREVGGLDDDALQPIKEVYFDRMKPAVTEEQRALLRQRYQIRRKESFSQTGGGENRAL